MGGPGRLGNVSLVKDSSDEVGIAFALDFYEF